MQSSIFRNDVKRSAKKSEKARKGRLGMIKKVEEMMWRRGNRDLMNWKNSSTDTVE
jgi:hypothetical protein